MPTPCRVIHGLPLRYYMPCLEPELSLYCHFFFHLLSFDRYCRTLQVILLHFANFRQVPAATRPYLHNSEDGDSHFDSCGVYEHYISDSVQYTEQ